MRLSKLLEFEEIFDCPLLNLGFFAPHLSLRNSASVLECIMPELMEESMNLVRDFKSVECWIEKD